MPIVTGTVVGGKVILEGDSLPEGTVVAVFARDDAGVVRLPPELKAELEQALDEAEREPGMPAGEFLTKLRKKYG